MHQEKDQMRMRAFQRFIASGRQVSMALLLATGLFLMVSAPVSAHAILLRSDPAKDAVLPRVPQQVRMWFSEDLNPAFSTVVVVNGANKRIDKRDAHVASSDSREMDLSLPSDLFPAVYVVIYRTDSNDDGHVLTGSFLFTIARPDGTVPTLSPEANPGANALGGSNLRSQNTGQLDGLTFFTLVVVTLAELGAVFWVGAFLWQIFVLQPATAEHPALEEGTRRAQQRFERWFLLPTLLVLGLSTLGVLIGQAMTLTNGHLAQAFAPALLTRLATHGRFGAYWLMREIILLVAVGLSLFQAQGKERPYLSGTFLQWAQLLLGFTLVIAMTMSSHAAAVSGTVAPFALMADFLHLVAAALWVGGMLYIAVIYVPVLRPLPREACAYALLTVLPYYSFSAGAGVLLMALTGPFSATVHLTSWEQLVTTAYGRVLIVKSLLVGGLLLTSAFHVLLLRPRLRKAYQKYAVATQRLQVTQMAPTVVPGPSIHEETEPQPTLSRISEQMKLREQPVRRRTHRLTQILSVEPILGVAVLVCVGLMSVFAGTLVPGTTASPPSATKASSAFQTTVKTVDGKFLITLMVSPNTAGPNVFTVSVREPTTDQLATNVGVSLSITHLDMDMGTDAINLQPDGKGHFSAPGDLVMGGNFQIRIQIRTTEETMHEATIKMLTPV